MPNPKITLNDMRIVIEALEQRQQTLEAAVRKLNEEMQKVSQAIQFERF